MYFGDARYVAYDAAFSHGGCESTTGYQCTSRTLAVKFRVSRKPHNFYTQDPMTKQTTTSVHDRLSELSIALPAAPKPVASYIPCVRTGNLIAVSGQLPMKDGQLLATGTVPGACSLEKAHAAARQCAINGLAVLADALGGDLNRVKRIVRLGVFVASEAGFTDQPKVANGASELMQQVFGENGRHARAAVGSIALPLGASVEVEMLVEVE